MNKSEWIVPYNYLTDQFNNREEIFEKWRQLILSSEFTLGPFVKEFENNFANFIGSRYCVSTNNGTDALILALKAVGIKSGDEVITVPNSFYATTGAIVNCGANPIFVDVDSQYQMDYKLIEPAITNRTKAILPVYWAGGAPKMKKILNIANKYGLSVVEDACMGIGGKHDGIPMGRFGQVSAFSMHPLKTLNVMGDGGMVTTDDKNIYDWMLQFRNHGMVDRDHIKIWGVNMRLQPLQAVVADIELKKIHQIVKTRNENASYLDAKLASLFPHVITPPRVHTDLNTYSLYMVTCEKRDLLVSYLRSKQIDVKVHYPIPLHLQEAAVSFRKPIGSFPITEMQAKHLMTIPIHQYISKDQLDYVFASITAFYNKN